MKKTTFARHYINSKKMFPPKEAPVLQKRQHRQMNKTQKNGFKYNILIISTDRSLM